MRGGGTQKLNKFINCVLYVKMYVKQTKTKQKQEFNDKLNALRMSK